MNRFPASSGLALCNATARVAALCFQLPTTGDATPEWVELIPAPDKSGSVTGFDGRSWKMPDASRIAANFSLKLPFDINHSTHVAALEGRESPAAGWITSLQARNGAVWGQVQWNERGREALNSKSYGFVSPAFAFDKDGTITRLKSAALCNEPNFPLALNRAAFPEEDSAMNPILKALLTALGLAESATEQEATTAMNKLKGDLQVALNRAETPSLDKFVPRGDYDIALNRASTAEQQLQKIKDDQHTATVTTEVDAAVKAGKVTPATKDYYLAMCKREGGLEEFRKFVAAAPVILASQAQVEGPAPEKTQANPEGLSESQLAMCSRLGMSPKEYAVGLNSGTYTAKK